MAVIHQILVMLVTLGILVIIHEYGHYWVARRNGVKVLRFSMGFGPVIYRRFNREGTEFALSLLPLGGYVKMLDEREGPVAESELPVAFNNKPVLGRMAIVAAGPLANLALAFLVYWLLFLQGSTGLVPRIYTIAPDSLAARAGLVAGLQITHVDGIKTPTVGAAALQLMNRIGDAGQIVISARKPETDIDSEFRLPISQWLGKEEGNIDIFESLGIGFYDPVIEPVVDEVLPDSPGQQAGLLKGDRLLSADAHTINDWNDWVQYVRARPGQVIHMMIARQGADLSVDITPVPKKDDPAAGFVGVQVKLPVAPPELLVKEDLGIPGAALAALKRAWQASLFTLRSMGRILVGDISYKQLSGPISIAKVASESANSGIYSYLSLLALLSVSLGVLNLLPVPVLDGGHIFFYSVEWLKGSPVPEKIQQVAYQLGMMVVLSVMVLAMFNDLGRL